MEHFAAPTVGPTLLDSIADFCRQAGMAESTFGRRAVNDGKLVSRLRYGARVTPETLQRVSAFMKPRGSTVELSTPPELMQLFRATGAPVPRTVVDAADAAGAIAAPSRNFRFFDNRQKYLLFVNTCSEKDVVAQRVGLEPAHIHPRPPAIRLFDAGMGDCTVLTQVMRQMRRRAPGRRDRHARVPGCHARGAAAARQPVVPRRVVRGVQEKMNHPEAPSAPPLKGLSVDEGQSAADCLSPREGLALASADAACKARWRTGKAGSAAAAWLEQVRAAGLAC